MNGRKRHLLVDTQGVLLSVHVTSADVHDEYGGGYLLRQAAADFPRLRHIWVDGAYRRLFAAYAWHCHGIQTHRTLQRQGEPMAAKRWVVERSFAWLGRYRRLSKDYEYFCQTSVNWIYVAMSHLLVKRLGRLRAF